MILKSILNWYSIQINQKIGDWGGAAAFLNPVYDKEDLKLKRLPKYTNFLQTLQKNII